MNKIKLVAIEDLEQGMKVTDTDDPSLTTAEAINEQYGTENLEWYDVIEYRNYSGAHKLQVKVRGEVKTFRAYESILVWTLDESESLATIKMLNDATDEFIAQELRSHALQDTEYAKLVRIEAAFRSMN